MVEHTRTLDFKIAFAIGLGTMIAAGIFSLSGTAVAEIGSIAVIVSVLAVEVTGITVIDPIAAALIAGVVLWSAGKVLRGSGAIFLLETPFDPESVRAGIEAIEGVDRIDDLHAWQICSQITVATAHVETSVGTMRAAESINRDVHRVLAEHGVDHATVELSPAYADRHTHLDAHAH